jgi:hypothetical protein
MLGAVGRVGTKPDAAGGEGGHEAAEPKDTEPRITSIHCRVTIPGTTIVKNRFYEYQPLGAWRTPWQCGLAEVVFFVSSHAVFLSSFFRFDVLV